jgi:MarR family transcriptional regulator, lower aerobic nicotinate degradation pathway regulator
MQSRRPADPEVARAVLDSIRRIVRHLRESSRAAEKSLGIGGAQLFVLQVLAREGSLSVNALAERTLTHQSSVSMVVARLVESGLISRARSRSDARRLELALTARGRAVLRRAPLASQQDLIRGIERLAGRERRALAAGLGALVAAMGLAATPPTMFFHDDRASRRQRARR